jgi:hypothetical protein
MKKTIYLLLFMLLPLSAYLQTYVDEAQGLEVLHNYTGFLAGGVSFYDFDQDGWDDLSLATGPGEKLQFYRNIEGKFTLVTPFVNHTEDAKQVIWVDFDNDGDKDLYVTTFKGINRLYENIGALELIDITSQAGLAMNDGQSFGACWGDYNRDGWLDLYYADRKGPEDQLNNECRLYMNNADGTFEEMTATAGVSDKGKKPFCSSFLDYNKDGWPDIYTAHDKLTINSLFKNNKDGSFTNVGEQTQTDIAMFAMCVAVGDYDNSGRQDIYVSNTVGNVLLKNLGYDSDIDDHLFDEVAEETGVIFNSVGWGSNFLDGNNDAHLDLYVSGSVIGSGLNSSAYYSNNRQQGFDQVNTGFVGDTVASYSNAVGDFNNDGYPEIVVSNIQPFSSQFWVAEPGDNHWIKLNLEGKLSNKDAIGSMIYVYTDTITQFRYTQCGVGFLGQNSGIELIGTGEYTTIDSVKIIWPSGHVDKFYSLDADQVIDIVEGSSTNGVITPADDVHIISSTDNIKNSNLIILYPNPVIDQLHIDSKVAFKQLKIYDQNGKMVLSQNNPQKRDVINVSNLASGIYFMRLLDANGNREVIKWVKL